MSYGDTNQLGDMPDDEWDRLHPKERHMSEEHKDLACIVVGTRFVSAEIHISEDRSRVLPAVCEVTLLDEEGVEHVVRAGEANGLTDIAIGQAATLHLDIGS